MEAATILITPETLRQRAQECRDRAEALREETKRCLTDAMRLDREADALAEAERLRSMRAPTPSARASLGGEIAAYLARCSEPKSSSEIALHFGVSSLRTRAALELLAEIGMVYRSGLKRGTRYRILRDGEEPPNEAQPFGERWHERVRDVAIRLGTFTQAEIVAELPELADSTIYRWLGRLVEDGILTRERVGKGYLYAYEPCEASRAPQRSREDRAPRRDRAVAGTGKSSKVARGDVAEVVRIAKAAGAEIKPQKHGYGVVMGGAVVTSIPKTPSDHRSLKNARGSLRRNGVRP